MGSTLERRRVVWGGRALGAVLALLAIGFVRSQTSAQVEPTGRAGHVLPAAAVADTPAPASAELPGCQPGQVAITREDVGVGDSARCLPLGGAEVRGSRVDPLYGRIATELLASIAGRAHGFAADVKAICWSKADWNELVAAFRDAGRMEPRKYWLGCRPAADAELRVQPGAAERYRVRLSRLLRRRPP